MSSPAPGAQSGNGAGAPPPTAADLAAEALLGSLVWDSRRVEDLPWLEPQDFSDPQHAAVFATVRGLRAAGRPADAHRIEVALRAGEFHDVRGDVSDRAAALLHTLLSTTPATPPATRDQSAPARSEHIRYGQIVLDDAIRRQVTAAGVRIGRATRSAVAVDHETAAERIEEILEDAVDRLQGLVNRFRAPAPADLREPRRTAPAGAPGTGPRGSRVSTDGAESTDVDADADADDVEIADEVDRLDGGLDRPPLEPRQIARAERRLIGSCLTDTDLRDAALDQLVPADFADAGAAATWAAITELDRRGEPVDVVFVAVELEHRSGADPPDGLRFDHLRALATHAVPATGPRDLDTVARAALERIGLRAHRELAAIAADKGRPSAELIAVAHRALNAALRRADRVGTGAARHPAPDSPRPRAALQPPAGRGRARAGPTAATPAGATPRRRGL